VSVNRPRRALLEEPEDEGDHVAHVPRRSSGFAPAPDEPQPESEEDLAEEDRDDEADAEEEEPPPRPRRAMSDSPASPDAWQSPPPPVPIEVFRPATMAASAARKPLGDGSTRRSPQQPTVGHAVEPIIIERLVKSYNGTLAVRNLSFSVDPGRITGFLGPNGAGKTTTLRILVGLATATTGTATFGGVPYAQLEKPQQRVGAVLDASFHPGRTGRNHLRVLAATAGASDARVDELLDLVGLSKDGRRPAGQYSLGMRQRLALASALLGDPDYLILDEPANGLDPEGIRWLRHFLREFADSGRAVLVSSHLLNEVQATVDEIVVINKGRLLAQMPMSDLQLGQGTTRVRVSDLDEALTALAPLNARVERGQDAQGHYLRVHSHEVAAVGAALFSAGVVVNELITERRDLEEEFFSMLEGAR
jgi:ABC-2 type transport system ATP-binding protein